MSSLSSTWPSDHLNKKFKQKFLKVLEGPKLGRKIMTCIYRIKKKTCRCLLKSYTSFKVSELHKK